MRFLKFVLLHSFLSCFLFSCSGSKTEKITIATAANMQFAMKALSEDFTKKTGIHCELVFSSSGKLTAQIIEGAPYDLFVAANMKYPEAVYKSGLSTEKPKIYASGKIVLWSMTTGLNPSINVLKSDSVRYIALANPKTAPYGLAALEVLQHYDIEEKLKDKLVFGESIAQTNQFITSNAAGLGFTAMSVVLSPQMKNKGQWIEIPDQLYKPIEQGVVVIKNENLKNSQLFYNYLFSEEARKLLEEYGYLVN